MATPTFTAEATLYQTSYRYRSTSRHHASGATVFPAQLPTARRLGADLASTTCDTSCCGNCSCCANTGAQHCCTTCSANCPKNVVGGDMIRTVL